MFCAKLSTRRGFMLFKLSQGSTGIALKQAAQGGLRPTGLADPLVASLLGGSLAATLNPLTCTPSRERQNYISRSPIG